MERSQLGLFLFPAMCRICLHEGMQDLWVKGEGRSQTATG